MNDLKSLIQKGFSALNEVEPEDIRLLLHEQDKLLDDEVLIESLFNSKATAYEIIYKSGPHICIILRLFFLNVLTNSLSIRLSFRPVHSLL